MNCSHRPPCPGCPRFGHPGVDRTAFARLAAFAERAGLPPPHVFEGPLYGFRHRARLAVRGRAKNPKIGIFKAGSHHVVHIPSCAVHHPLVNEVAGVARRVFLATGALPYSDTAHQGDIRSLQIVVERSSQTAQVVVTTRADDPKGLEPLFSALSEALGPRLHSLFWNGQPERSNTLLGPHFHKFQGPDSVVEVWDGVRVHFPPGAFGQNNLPLFDALGARVRALVPDGARVLELYAGSGALGLPLLGGHAPRVRSLGLNELGEGSLEGLRLGIAELPEPLRTRIHVYPGSAGLLVDRIAEADVVIADPPRKGLDQELLGALSKTPPERFIWVSCGLDAFLTQSEELLGLGNLKLSTLEIFALFPFTEHMETLTVFERRSC